jgi:hypothetical protein
MFNLNLISGVPYRLILNYPDPGGTPPVNTRIFWSLERNGQILSNINFPSSSTSTESPQNHPSKMVSGLILNPTSNQTANIELLENDIIRIKIESKNAISLSPAILEATAQIKQFIPNVELDSVKIRLSTIPNDNTVSRIPFDTENNPVGQFLFAADLSNASTNIPVTRFSNGIPLEYVWKRGNIVIQSGTNNQYFITNDDKDSVISVDVIARNNKPSTRIRTASTIIGEVDESYENSHIGTHLGGWAAISYYGDAVPFVNLIYSSCNDVRKSTDSFAQPVFGSHTNLFGNDVGQNWGDRPEIMTEDGWIYQTVNGDNLSNNSSGGPKWARLLLHIRSAKLWTRWFSILNIEGEYSNYEPKGPDRKERIPDIVFGELAEGKRFSYEVHTYWQGNGYAETSINSNGANVVPTSVNSVNFTGPNNQGPWGTNNDDENINGPQMMWKKTNVYNWNYGAENEFLMTYITRSTKPQDEPAPWDWNTGPVRNVMAMIGKVTDITDPNNPKIVYSGFDHTTYNPFQVYPNWLKTYKHNKCLRSLTLGHVREHMKRPKGRNNDSPFPAPNPVSMCPGPHQLIFQNEEQVLLDHIPHPGGRSIPNRRDEMGIPNDGSATIYTQQYYETQPMVKMGWIHASPDGANRGEGQMSRPTYVCFGRSVRALTELCNWINADLWWCHFPYVTFVGTKDEQGEITYAVKRGRSGAGSSGALTYPYDPNEVGYLMLDEEYVDNFVELVDRHLNPNLKLYNEYANEIWNFSDSYREAYDYSATLSNRIISDINEGGDGNLVGRTIAMGNNAWFPGAASSYNSSGTDVPRLVYGFLSTALITRRMREKLTEKGSSRKLVAIGAGRINGNRAISHTLSHCFNTMPKLFKELDAISGANYHGWVRAKGRYPEQPLTSESGQAAVDQLWSIPVNRDFIKSPLVMLGTPLLPAPSVPPAGTPSWFIGSPGIQEAAAGSGSSILRGANMRYISLDLPGNFRNWQYDFAEGVQNVTDWRPVAITPGTRNVGTTGAGNMVNETYNVPPGWPSGRRRWNLQLFAYEGGPYPDNITGDDNRIYHGVQLSPDTYKFKKSYYEAYFYPVARGITRDPVPGQKIGNTNVNEDDLYREGMVPDTHVLFEGPMFDLTVDMVIVGNFDVLFATDAYWNGHKNAPRMNARFYAASKGLGEPDWWVDYDYGDRT